MSSTIEKWSVHHLKGIIDYLDDASLLQLTQTALNMSTPEEVATHFAGLLGDDPKSYAFIAEFNSRRFPPTTKASVPSRRAEHVVQPGSRQDTPERKADSKISKTKPIGNTTLTSDLGTKSKPKVKKVDALTEIDAALKQLELDSSKALLSCDCAARRHGLNQVSPNCLSCGKIICSIESYSKCSFCHADLLSRNQKDDIIAELKRERGVESAAIKNQKKKASAGTGAKNAYANKAGGYNSSSTTTTTAASQMNDAELRAKTDAAEARKDELLRHVASGYRRTVIDQASDFHAESRDKWSSPAERALALRRAQAAMHADTETRRVMTISLTGKGGVKSEKAARRTEEEVDADIIKEQKKLDAEKRKEEEEQAKLNNTHTRNKLMCTLGRLTFTDAADGAKQQVESQDWWTRGQKGWTRVQDYNDDDDDNDDPILSSSAMDGQPGRTEELGTSKRG